MANDVRLTFGVGDITRDVYSLYQAREMEMVKLNIICWVILCTHPKKCIFLVKGQTMGKHKAINNGKSRCFYSHSSPLHCFTLQ